MIVNRLKETTIKRYDARQLRRHLDRLLNAFDSAPYRIDQYQVGYLSARGDAYFFYCNLNNRDAIIDAIKDVYQKLGI